MMMSIRESRAGGEVEGRMWRVRGAEARSSAAM